MKALIVVVVAVGVCHGVWQRQPGSAPPPPPPPHSAISDGAALYTKFCTQCHGADAKGYKSDHAPSLVNPTFLESATDLFLTRSIEVGRPGTAMAGYGKSIGGPLDVVSVQKIVAWLRAQGKSAAGTLTPVAPGPGDATRGGPLYTTNCLKCHGDQQTRGDAIHLANAQFLDLASDTFLFHAIVNGRPGTPMVAWKTVLSDQDIADVIAYVHTFGQAPAIGALPPPTGTEPLFINPDGKAPTFTMHGDPCPPNTPCKPDLRYVPADQVKQALDQKRKLVIIDARPASEWMRAHITGAVSIPHYDLTRLDEIPKSAWIVAYCACPHHLSGIVVDELRKRGYTHAEVLDEGILEWQRRGYPTVTAPGVTTPAERSAAAAAWNHPVTANPRHFTT